MAHPLQPVYDSIFLMWLSIFYDSWMAIITRSPNIVFHHLGKLRDAMKWYWVLTLKKLPITSKTIRNFAECRCCHAGPGSAIYHYMYEVCEKPSNSASFPSILRGKLKIALDTAWCVYWSSSVRPSFNCSWPHATEGGTFFKLKYKAFKFGFEY